MSEHPWGEVKLIIYGLYYKYDSRFGMQDKIKRNT